MMNSTIPGLVVLIGATPDDCTRWARAHHLHRHLVRTIDTIPVGVAFASDQLVVLPGWQPDAYEMDWWRNAVLYRLLHGVADEEFLQRLDEQVPGLIPPSLLG